MIRYWHVFTTPPLKERAAETILRKRGHMCIVPMHVRSRRLRKGGQGRTKIALPIYPRHVFVALSDQIWAFGDISHCRLVTGVLGFNGKPARIPDAEMQRFLDRLAQPEILAPQFTLKRGSKVAIKRWTFAHLHGTIEVVDGQSAKVLIDLFARSCETLVKLDDLQELEINSDSVRKQWTTGSKSFRRESGRREADAIR
jgi:transcription antitermination factor NusG